MLPSQVAKFVLVCLAMSTALSEEVLLHKQGAVAAPSLSAVVLGIKYTELMRTCYLAEFWMPRHFWHLWNICI